MQAHSFPKREFSNDEEFQAAIQAMDRVIEQEATVGGQPSEYYKGLRYQASGHEASIVGRDYPVAHHPKVLDDLRILLKEHGITPKGTIEESTRGVLTASLHFFNERFNIQRMVGAIDAETPCYLGIIVSNSYGAPALCLTLDAQAQHGDGTQYVLSDRLGAKRIRHVGKMQQNLHKLIREMLASLPDLGRHITDAKGTELSREQCTRVLRALEYGPKARDAILNRKPTTAWTLYDGLCRHARRAELGAASRLQELRTVQAILNPHQLHTLIERGLQMELDEAAARETKSQTRLFIEAEAVEASA